MGIWESNSVEKNFEELVEEINKVKGWTLGKIKKMEDTTKVKKIQQFKPTGISKTQINIRDTSGYYSKSKYIQIVIPEDVYKNINDKSLVNEFLVESKWSDTYFKLTILENNQDKLAKFKQILDVICASDQEIHEENLTIAVENKKVESVILNMLEQVGIRTKYYGYKTSHSTKQTEQYYNFPTKIRNQIPRAYSENSLEDKKKSLLTQIDNYWNKEITKLKEERLQKEKEQKEKEQNRKLALLLAKYDLDLDHEWSDIMDAILEKDKYLRLAYYLEKNRGDWTSGCDYAESGLSQFSVETEVDQKIFGDINDYIEDWDRHMDGRVFRDCEYNYSVLYGMVEDSDLMKDFETVQEQLQDW